MIKTGCVGEHVVVGVHLSFPNPVSRALDASWYVCPEEEGAHGNARPAAGHGACTHEECKCYQTWGGDPAPRGKSARSTRSRQARA
eukprot:7513130-Pyramimonas_sp.AAC.1